MEGDESKSPSSVQDDTQIHSDFKARLVENIADFRQCVKEVSKEIGQEEDFKEVTAESYNQKKAYMKTHLLELSFFHTVLADEHVRLLEHFKNKCTSSATTISSLEEDVANLNKQIQTLKSENIQLKQEIEENETDVRAYMSETKQETKAMEEELKASKETARKIEEQMDGVLLEKATETSMHDSEVRELKMKMYQQLTEMSHLHGVHEKKEGIWNDVTRKLYEDLKERGELVAEMSKNMEDLMSEKDGVEGQLDRLWGGMVIKQLKTDLSTNYQQGQSVEELIRELKLKVAELEAEVERQREGISGKEQ